MDFKTFSWDRLHQFFFILLSITHQNEHKNRLLCSLFFFIFLCFIIIICISVGSVLWKSHYFLSSSKLWFLNPVNPEAMLAKCECASQTVNVHHKMWMCITNLRHLKEGVRVFEKFNACADQNEQTSQLLIQVFMQYILSHNMTKIGTWMGAKIDYTPISVFFSCSRSGCVVVVCCDIFCALQNGIFYSTMVPLTSSL